MNKEWFIFKNTHHLGPFSKEEMVSFYQKNEINNQSLVFKEGAKNWTPFEKIYEFQFLFTEPDDLPPLPEIPTLPKAIQSLKKNEVLLGEEFPPPLPLDVVLDFKNETGLQLKKKSSLKIWLMMIFILSIFLFGGYIVFIKKGPTLNPRIEGLMPIYVERLESIIAKKDGLFEVSLALSLDGSFIYGATNKPGEFQVQIEMESIPNKILGNEDVQVVLRGNLKNHIAKFSRIIINKGSKFFSGEYRVHVEALEIHLVNQFLNKIFVNFNFESLNQLHRYDGSNLFFAGTPRDFEQKLNTFILATKTEALRPLQDKLELLKTLDSILDSAVTHYLAILNKIMYGKSISLFEAKFIKEISPLLEAVMLKAESLGNEFVLWGKQIGEMSSDMITNTTKIIKLEDQDKKALKKDFSERSKNIKTQIDLNIKKTEEQINKIEAGG